MNLPPGTTEAHISRGWEIGAGDEPVSEPYDPRYPLSPRQVMRGWAMSYRAWIHPEAFDGTGERYNANLAMAAACLMEARACKGRPSERGRGLKQMKTSQEKIHDMIQTFNLGASPDLMASRILDILDAMNRRMDELEVSQKRTSRGERRSEAQR